MKLALLVPFVYLTTALPFPNPVNPLLQSLAKRSPVGTGNDISLQLKQREDQNKAQREAQQAQRRELEREQRDAELARQRTETEERHRQQLKTSDERREKQRRAEEESIRLSGTVV